MNGYFIGIPMVVAGALISLFGGYITKGEWDRRQKAREAVPAEDPAARDAVSAPSAGAGSVYGQSGTIHAGTINNNYFAAPPKEPVPRIELPMFQIETLNGFTAGPHTDIKFPPQLRAGLKQHQIVIRNPNSFPIESAKLRLQLPEFVIHTQDLVKPVDCSFNWRPERAAQLVASENVNTVGKGNDNSAIIILEFANLRQGESITLSFITTDAFKIFIEGSAESFFVEGQFTPKLEGAKPQNVFARFSYSEGTRSLSLMPLISDDGSTPRIRAVMTF